jgi:GNAT superfamily N-acetyltransferase
MIQIRSLNMKEIPKIADVDRSEHVSLGYRFLDGVLDAMEVDWHIPTWTESGIGEFHLGVRMKDLRAKLQSGARVFGAFDGDKLVGYALLREQISESMAQLADLFVSRADRRKGVATKLVSEAINLARAGGAKRLYVSAVPSESAVGFYLSRGFKPTHDVQPELFALEPDDVHMILMLQPSV